LRRIRDAAAGRPGLQAAVALCALLMLPRSGMAEDAAGLCLRATAAAATTYGVPDKVLLAIALTESGRSVGGRLQPWPWTVNAGGEGHWFADRAGALRFAQTLVAAGQTSFDVGCFQINYRWHGAAFGSVEAMFDPDRNAAYAARFLAGLAAETGGWSGAAGAYHSRTPALAERYRARFDAILAGLGEGQIPDPPQQRVARDDPPGPRGYSHPLLQGRDVPRTAGSLVPLAPVPAT
jgi:hypothetical protein